MGLAEIKLTHESELFKYLKSLEFRLSEFENKLQIINESIKQYD